jgi:hypothetical protein
MLSGLAAVAVLTVLANVPADAQQPGQHSGVQASQSAASGSSMPKKSKRLRSGQQQTTAVAGSSILALGVLRRKCLDALLPDTC